MKTALSKLRAAKIPWYHLNFRANPDTLSL